jgi:hypothetical protein
MWATRCEATSQTRLGLERVAGDGGLVARIRSTLGEEAANDACVLPFNPVTDDRLAGPADR